MSAPVPNTPPAFEVRGLTAGYDSTVVLRQIDLTVAHGGVLALLGPNGAGKTTLLRTISGLLRPMAGQILIDGNDVTHLRPCKRSRRGMCLIPEGSGIYPALTVRENLALFVERGQERAACEQAADIFPILGEKLNQRAGLLSGGQQQMLAVVRSYLVNPQLVLVDEVSMGLAPLVIDAIYEFIGRLAATGATLVIVEQYVTRALAVADQACVMTRGQIVYSGAPGDLADADLLDHYFAGGATQQP